MSVYVYKLFLMIKQEITSAPLDDGSYYLRENTK